MGERREYREGMERFTGQLVREGMPAPQAEKAARESVLRVERSRLEKGQGPPRGAR